MDVFNRIFASIAGESPEPGLLMIDATHLKAHRTAASLAEQGAIPVGSGVQRAVEALIADKG
jgi:transposase